MIGSRGFASVGRQSGRPLSLQFVERGFFGRGVGGGVVCLGSSHGEVAGVVVGFEAGVQCGVVLCPGVVAEFSKQLLQVVVCRDVFGVDHESLLEGLDGFFQEGFSLDGDIVVSELSCPVEVGLTEQVDHPVVLAEVKASLDHLGRPIFEHALEILLCPFELVEILGDESREPGDGPGWRRRIGVF